MFSIAVNNLKNKKILVIILLLSGFLMANFIFSPAAQAALKTSDELQKAAEKYCASKNAGDAAACRNGYRHGYRGDETSQVACVTRTTSSVKYDQSETEACKKGFGQGSTEKNKDGGGSSSGGRLGADGQFICGTYKDEGRNVDTKFDFGCLGTAYEKSPGSFPNSSKNISPILDFVYAIIRFLSIGVGIAITIALIVSGIQYSASEGNAEVSTKAKKRVESAITGLVIYIFTWSLLQFLIPGGVFK